MTILTVTKATQKDINLLIDIAKKIGIDLQQSSTGLMKPAVKQMSLKEKRYLNNLKRVAKDIRENNGKKQYQSAQSFLDEL